MEMCAPSVTLQLIESQEEWLTHQMAVVPMVQRDLGRLEKWSDRNLIQFNKRTCKVLQKYTLRAKQLQSSSAEKDVGVSVDKKLTMS